MMQIEKYKLDVDGASSCFQSLMDSYLSIPLENQLSILNQSSENKILELLKLEIKHFMGNLKELKQQLQLIIQSVKKQQNKNNQQEQKRGYYNSYSSQFKKVVIETVENLRLTMNQAGELFHIPAKNVFRWCNKGYTKRKGGGRKSLDQKMEQQIYIWLGQCEKINKIVTANQVRAKAMQISTAVNFKASKGWLDKFRARFNLPKFPNSLYQKSNEKNKETPKKNKKSKKQTNQQSQDQRSQQSIFEQQDDQGEQQKKITKQQAPNQQTRNIKNQFKFQKDFELINVVSTLANELLQNKKQNPNVSRSHLKCILPSPTLNKHSTPQKNNQLVEKRRSSRNSQFKKVTNSKLDQKQLPNAQAKINFISSNNMVDQKYIPRDTTFLTIPFSQPISHYSKKMKEEDELRIHEQSSFNDIIKKQEEIESQQDFYSNEANQSEV